MKAAIKGKLPTYASFPATGPSGTACAGCDYIRPLVKRGDHWLAAPPGIVKWCSKLIRGTTAADATKPHSIGALPPMTASCKHYKDLSKRKTAP